MRRISKLLFFRPLMRFTGMVYRAHIPAWSFEPLSGAGAAKYGGRFNPVGTPALYSSLTEITALAEYRQGFPHRPQPTTLCAYNVDCEDIIDISDPKQQALFAVKASDISSDWEYQLHNAITPTTWILVTKMIQNNIAGIIAPSFAVNAPENAHNLILWKWGDVLPHQVLLIDDDRRLPENQTSWNKD